MSATLNPKRTEKGGGLIEIAPGKWANQPLRPISQRPEVVLCDLIPLGNGTYTLKPRTWERLVPLPDVAPLLGFKGTDTLRRLIQSGFVDGARVAPGVYTLNLDSYFRHMARCAEDPSYWEDKKVLAQYRSVLPGR